jgi:hypothetical protein
MRLGKKICVPLFSLYFLLLQILWQARSKILEKTII